MSTEAITLGTFAASSAVRIRDKYLREEQIYGYSKAVTD